MRFRARELAIDAGIRRLLLLTLRNVTSEMIVVDMRRAKVAELARQVLLPAQF